MQHETNVSVGPSTKVMRKAKMSFQSGQVKQVIRTYAVEIQTSDKKELDASAVEMKLRKAMGANCKTIATIPCQMLTHVKTTARSRRTKPAQPPFTRQEIDGAVDTNKIYKSSRIYELSSRIYKLSRIYKPSRRYQINLFLIRTHASMLQARYKSRQNAGTRTDHDHGPSKS